MSRNDALDGLLALGAALPPGGAGTSWGETGRKMKAPEDCQMPALLQVDGDTEVTTKLGLLNKRVQQVTWVIYHNAGSDLAVEPARFTANLIDLIEATFNGHSGRGVTFETLGGNAYAAYIDGAIRRFAGDLDGIELITVPFSVLLP